MQQRSTAIRERSINQALISVDCPRVGRFESRPAFSFLTISPRFNVSIRGLGPLTDIRLRQTRVTRPT
jgi:hypothetical protein